MTGNDIASINEINDEKNITPRSYMVNKGGTGISKSNYKESNIMR